MKSHPMAPVDAAWYHIDGPANTAMITSIALTGKPLDFARVKTVYTQRLAQFERFRCRVVENPLPLATPHWEEVPGFEIGQQMHHVALPAPGGRAALAALLNDLASTPLDRARPLWDVHVVDGVDGGSALITRMHHCIGDGTASLLVARALFDASPRGWRTPPPAAPRRTTKPGLVGRLFAPAIDAAEWSVEQLRSIVGGAIDAAAHPQQLAGKAALVLAGAGTLAAELLKAPDPRSPLKGEFGPGKRVAWSEPVAIDEVKAIGAPLGAKVNDVLVAAMTGALRHYLHRRGVDVDRVSLRAMVPVDLRPPGRASELGNEFGLVILELALGCRDPLARLRRTKAHMDELKRSPEAVAILALFNLFGRVPKAVEDLAVQLFGSKASLVMTNVAGPKEPLYLAGVPIERVMFWVPHPGKELGMGVSILSYKGYATLSVVADAHLVPDPEWFTERFSREFASLQKAVQRHVHKQAAAKAAPGRRRPKARARPNSAVESPPR
ncbi:MAG: wax ester/triacylglycerol synthase family O-acyltransferase [Burkholderiales bacterium]|nr:wax ester/triacylglycerol synthase family O-acyltransferase [Burkholderiales bacterium]